MSDSFQPHGLLTARLLCPWNSPGQNAGVVSHSLLQGIFPTQGSNPGLLHCRPVLYCLSQQGSPRILEWIAYPFSRVSSWPRNGTGVLLHYRQILYQLSYQGSSLQSIGNYKWNEKTTHRMRENICKQCNQQESYFQNLQTAHAAQYQKIKQPKSYGPKT